MLGAWLQTSLSYLVSPRSWFSLCPVKLFGPINTPAGVQHSLQGRCKARAGLDKMWYVFTPLLCGDELKRSTEHCDHSTMHLFSFNVKTPLLLWVAGLLWLVSFALWFLPHTFSMLKKIRNSRENLSQCRDTEFLVRQLCWQEQCVARIWQGENIINFNVSIRAGSGNVIGH